MDRNEKFHGHAILNSISGAKLLPFLSIERPCKSHRTPEKIFLSYKWERVLFSVSLSVTSKRNF